MTTTGWIFMIVSIGFVVALVGWCFKQVLSDDGIKEPPASLGG